MEVKILEIRDIGTMIPLVCIDMNPSNETQRGFVQRWYLRRSGYPCDGAPNIAVAHLAADGTPFTNDPFGQGGRTMPVAHNYIIEHWPALKDGDVVDVEFILGESAASKISERLGG